MRQREKFERQSLDKRQDGTMARLVFNLSERANLCDACVVFKEILGRKIY